MSVANSVIYIASIPWVLASIPPIFLFLSGFWGCHHDKMTKRKGSSMVYHVLHEEICEKNRQNDEHLWIHCNHQKSIIKVFILAQILLYKLTKQIIKSISVAFCVSKMLGWNEMLTLAQPRKKPRQISTRDTSYSWTIRILYKSEQM